MYMSGCFITFSKNVNEIKNNFQVNYPKLMTFDTQNDYQSEFLNKNEFFYLDCRKGNIQIVGSSF